MMRFFVAGKICPHHDLPALVAWDFLFEPVVLRFVFVGSPFFIAYRTSSIDPEESINI